MIKKFLSIALIASFALMGAACSKVPAGNVGVKVYLLGGDKGVDHEELGPGRYYIGWNEELFLFPTFTQNYVWTKDPAEGSETDESITFQTKEGLEVGADIGISYKINPAKVPQVFQKYRRGIEEITDTFLRNMVRDAFVAQSSILPVEAVYGKGKSDLLADVEKHVRIQTDPIGIEIERIYFIGGLRLPPSVVTAVNAKLKATQQAHQRRNEVAEAEAEADKKRAAAQGIADAIRYKAEADAERVASVGAALRANPEVLKRDFIDKWNGVLPRVMGEDNQLLLMLGSESPIKK